jgi:plasmid stability protein
MKKNLTLSIDENLLQKARVLAAMRKTSVNEMIRKFLDSSVKAEKTQDVVTAKLLKLADSSKGRLGDYRPSRAGTYSGEPRFDR